jgi:crossover junction endodeoxyribonuclease RusA
VGKARPRLGKGRIYTPRSTKAYEEKVAIFALAAGAKATKAWVSVTIYLVFPTMRWPDIDNCAKAILDGLNGIAYKDDRQVCELHVTRRWGTNPSAYVSVREEDYV